MFFSLNPSAAPWRMTAPEVSPAVTPGFPDPPSRITATRVPLTAPPLPMFFSLNPSAAPWRMTAPDVSPAVIPRFPDPPSRMLSFWIPREVSRSTESEIALAGTWPTDPTPTRPRRSVTFMEKRLPAVSNVGGGPRTHVHSRTRTAGR